MQAQSTSGYAILPLHSLTAKTAENVQEERLLTSAGTNIQIATKVENQVSISNTSDFSSYKGFMVLAKYKITTSDRVKVFLKALWKPVVLLSGTGAYAGLAGGVAASILTAAPTMIPVCTVIGFVAASAIGLGKGIREGYLESLNLRPLNKLENCLKQARTSKKALERQLEKNFKQLRRASRKLDAITSETRLPLGCSRNTSDNEALREQIKDDIKELADKSHRSFSEWRVLLACKEIDTALTRQRNLSESLKEKRKQLIELENDMAEVAKEAGTKEKLLF